MFDQKLAFLNRIVQAKEETLKVCCFIQDNCHRSTDLKDQLILDMVKKIVSRLQTEIAVLRKEVQKEEEFLAPEWLKL